MGIFIETESRVVVTRVWGEGIVSYCFMSTEFQFAVMKKFWRWIVVMVYNIVNVLHVTEL